jgi:hypothetical protein
MLILPSSALWFQLLRERCSERFHAPGIGPRIVRTCVYAALFVGSVKALGWL